MSERYLVTGGAGFIGSHLTEHLLAHGSEVVVLDNFATGREDNLAPLRGDRLSVVRGSITDPDAIAAATRAGVAGIFHLAALPSVARSVEAPLESHEANALGTLQVLDHARRTGTKVVYAGSSSAYGDHDAPAKREDLRENPLSPYAATKLAGELYCRSFAHVYGIPVVVTRFFNVFGPRQVPDSPYSGVIAAFCYALLAGRRPRIDGDGSQSRDFTYVEDVARGLIAAMQAPTQGCHVVNLACGGSYTILELLQTLAQYAGVQVDPDFAPPRSGDVKHSRADVSKARELLDFCAQVPFSEGLKRTYDWYRSQYR
ncbi:MAG: NAD-dependent epimerase/dehydratase family protein [Planctomycetota bacterium]